jgi:putative hydrolase of the HAD superfamily
MSGTRRGTVWLFDLDNTLHDAGAWAFGQISAGMTEFLRRELDLPHDEADQLRRHYWQRYGATLLGVVRHHRIAPAHFLHDTHRLPGLEAQIRGHRHDLAAIAALRGRKVIVTNSPRHYAKRVLRALGIEALFDEVIAVEHMRMFGHIRPKPDARMLRALAVRLRVAPSRCVLVEDTLEHQKAARRVGFRTVWMRRYIARPVDAAKPIRARSRPPYVDCVTSALRDLHRWVPRGGIAQT